MDTIDEQALKFKLPAGMIVAGPSSSGKSTLVMKMLENYHEMFDPVPEEVLYCYGQFHKLVPKLQSEGIVVHAGLPSEETLDKARRPLLLVLDDMMLSASEKYLSDLYTKKNHHQQIFSIFLAQSLFEKNLKVARTNSQYILLTRAPNAILSIRTLGSQLFPRQLDFFMDAYNQATKDAWGYLMIDLHPASNPQLKLRTNIFPSDNRIVFIPKNA
jgi:hypothetical protein